MKCIECGSADNKFNYLCQECYIKANPIIDGRTRLKLSLCKICRTPSIKPDLWYEIPSTSKMTNNDLIIKAVIDLIELKFKIRPLKEKKITIFNLDERIFEIYEQIDIVQGSFSLSGIPDLFLPTIQINEDITIFLKYKKCKNCQLLSTGGAVKVKVQLRCVKRLMNKIDVELSSFYDRTKKPNFVVHFPLEEAKLKDGWDLLYKDKKSADFLIHHFKENFGAHIIETKETITYDRIKNKVKSKNVYSVRLPSYIIGDIVIYEDNPFQIVEIKSNSTTLYDYNNKTKISLENEYMLKSSIKSIYSNEELSKYQILSIDHFSKSVQIMNLESFEIHELQLDEFKFDLTEGLEVNCFTWDDCLFVDQLVPINIKSNL